MEFFLDENFRKTAAGMLEGMGHVRRASLPTSSQRRRRKARPQAPSAVSNGVEGPGMGARDNTMSPPVLAKLTRKGTAPEKLALPTP